MLSDNFAWLSVCQWLCACYRLETGWCIDEAGLPIHYHQCLGSTIPATFLHCSHAPLSTSTNPRNLRSATGGKLYTCTLDTEKNCIQAPGHQRLLSILTHTSGPGREGDMGQWDTTTRSLVAKQSMYPSSSCPSPLQPVSRRTGGRECSADQQQVCLLSRIQAVQWLVVLSPNLREVAQSAKFITDGRFGQLRSLHYSCPLVLIFADKCCPNFMSTYNV